MKQICLLILFVSCLFSTSAQTIFINEIHYDNDSFDQMEAVEIAGPVGTSLVGWTLLLYNGADGTVYDTIILASSFPNQDDGYGTLSFPTIGIENGAPDGMALVDNNNNVIQFLSYEGTFTATAGPANGMTSQDIGVSETGNTPIGSSLQLMGSGVVYTDFSWALPTPHTTNAVNNNQNFGAPVNDICANATPLACGDTFSVSTVAATATFPVANNCGFTIGEGVWYTFSSPVRGRFFIQGSNNVGGFPYLDIYEGDCTSLSCVGAMGGTPNSNIALIPNQDYYLYFHESNGNQPLDLDVSVTCGPWAVCISNPVFTLDANGEFNLTPQDLDNGSDSPNGIQSITVSRTSFDCSDVGIGQIVDLIVTDNLGLVDTCTTQVFIVDGDDPNIITQNITVPLDANGIATITPSMVDNGTTDNCSFTLSVNPSSFDCNDIGTNTVFLEAVDASGNDTSDMATVTIVDNLPPDLVTQTATVSLDSNGQASISVSDVVNTVTDNCTLDDVTVDISSFDCLNIGGNGVVVTAIDVNGNSVTQNAVVIVEDNTAPTVITQNLTIALDANGLAFITPAMVDNGTTDNCSFSLSLDIADFDCSDLGANTVVLTATDPSGNIATATAIITVEDTTAPVAVTQNIVVGLDGNGEASIAPSDIDNGSSDNCSITGSLDISNFDCNDIGLVTVTLTVTDPSGNTASETATVTVQDTLAPSVVGQDITIDLLGNPSVSILPGDVDNGTSDNCEFSLALSQDTFTAPGTYPIDLIAADPSGNTSSTTVMVTVIDSLGISEVSPLESLVIYPNPTKGRFYIQYEGIYQIVEIFDVQGRKALEFANQHTAGYPISNLSNGLYFVIIKDDQGVTMKKLLKR